ncbi:hypothetical protein TPHA_0C01110 [Tetrapisispora phaffii CBS 4417]|uniref:Purine-cytosine permease n=1 Tax=Tetrapisispora phaffii (strain ATCC 24235 / CBS 4417 / NBRC 1672 / NRRL Y-8282 / UCD 70-5) TaxID=1071381 RepID=G8BR91_TETPH|nr:hypothetical protein TPHA_0C01110 [Tetrapisispora phaffii CBS 4417]CCE62267.1 hypothetical protein TPHA_0C01110 [Tetrapisispora phaffii CBS 4417]
MTDQISETSKVLENNLYSAELSSQDKDINDVHFQYEKEHDLENSDFNSDKEKISVTSIDGFEEDTTEFGKVERKTNWIIKLYSLLNAEQKGVEPITDEEKNDDSIFGATTMWFSANMVVSSYALGVIGPVTFGLNFGTSILTIIFFTLLGIVWVAFFSIFGAEFGLRQMILSRFLVGNVTARVFSLINMVACAGWGIVNTIAAAQLISAVNPGPHSCPPWAGCIIITIGVICITFFGYKVIHTYEKWSWVPNFAVFLVLIAQLSRSGSVTSGDWGGGANTAAGVLSFGTSIFGYAAGWTTYAADYTVYMPRNTNKYKIFLSLCFGLAVPLWFTLILGAASAVGTFNNPVWNDYYQKNSVGGLTFAILAVDSLGGFGQFCCVLLAMSTIANQIPNMYSIALSAQALWDPLAKVPRPIWTLVGNCVVLGISIPAYYQFSGFLSDFMDSIGYYLSIYIAIAISEHFFWRRGFKGYNIDDWNKWDKLPIGIAGMSAFVVGVVGTALGMSQTYWTGEIGRLIGNEGGGDIGFELAFSWSFIVYNLVRPLELKYFGR